jgi:Insertion element 4 transposase N-terminal
MIDIEIGGIYRKCAPLWLSSWRNAAASKARSSRTSMFGCSSDQYLPFELVDDVLSETKTVQRRLRDLPSRVGVYFVLALVLFPRLGYGRVWQKLTAGLGYRPARDEGPVPKPGYELFQTSRVAAHTA